MTDTDKNEKTGLAQVIDFKKGKDVVIHQKKEQRFKEVQNAFKKALKLNKKKPAAAKASKKTRKGNKPKK